MRNKYLAAIMIVSGCFQASAQAAVVSETGTLNGSLASAQFIDGSYFDSAYDADINDNANNNISTIGLHASVMGTGDETVDYYSFTAAAGQAYFDIDYGMNSGGSFDPWMELYNSSGSLVQASDDFSVDSGSVHSYDSFISAMLGDGLYYVAVGKYGSLGPIPTGGTYTLQISQQVSAVPVPAAVWLFGSGLLGLIGIAKRKARA